MNISTPFIRRPVMTTLVMLGVLLFGLFGYIQLPVSDLPDVDYPTIVISASLPGADPETMASAVATPPRAAALHDCRYRFDDLFEFTRQHQYYPAIQSGYQY